MPDPDDVTTALEPFVWVREHDERALAMPASSARDGIRIYRTAEAAGAGAVALYGPPAVDRLERELREARGENEHLEAELEDARDQPWPAWATTCLKLIRRESGHDGYGDDQDGVDLPGELEELIAHLGDEADRHKAEARAARQLDDAERAQAHYRAKITELCAWVAVTETRCKLLSDRLAALEGANDALAAKRSGDTYLSMIDEDRCHDELEALDDARRAARAALVEAER